MLVVVAVVVAGGLFVASLPGGVDSGVVALATTTPKPTRTPRPTARPTPAPVVAPTAAPTPTPVPKPAIKPPARGARDLCDPILGFACGLEKGTYEPTRFEPGEPFATFLRTVVIGDHLDRLPPSERDAFVKAVVDQLPEPALDYVRLNITARRANAV